MMFTHMLLHTLTTAIVPENSNFPYQSPIIDQYSYTFLNKRIILGLLFANLSI